MATLYEQEVTKANNTKTAAIGARTAAYGAKAGLDTPAADSEIATGNALMGQGDAHLNAHQPNLATDSYATAHAHFSQAVVDANNKRAQDTANAAAAAAALERAAAAAQQETIARQTAAAAAAAAQAQAAHDAQAAAQAAAAAAAALAAKAAAAPVLEAAESAQAPFLAGLPAAPIAHAAQDRPVPTEYGHTLRSDQITIVRNVFNYGRSIGASNLVLAASYYAMMGESNINILTGRGGVFQTTCNLSAYNNGSDYMAQAHSFFNGGECYARGAISYSRTYDTAWQIANATEENAVWAARHGDSYEREGKTTADLTAEADYAVSWFLSTPYTSPQGVGQSPSTGSLTGESGNRGFDLAGAVKAIPWPQDAWNAWWTLHKHTAIAASHGNAAWEYARRVTFVKKSD